MANGKRQGVGTLTFSNGHLYEGDWVNDKKEGTGFELMRDGTIYLGHYL